MFATRAPTRPNPIGFSIVRPVGVEGNKVHIGGVDMVDGAPLLDIKPYVPGFDQQPAERVGWLEGASRGAPTMKADGRFE